MAGKKTLLLHYSVHYYMMLLHYSKCDYGNWHW